MGVHLIPPLQDAVLTQEITDGFEGGYEASDAGFLDLTAQESPCVAVFI